ncbi:MAG: DUF1858 domain-containing protein [Actinomycetota bacterium]|nr:DUF1858 domain-containing protein [Actinomycetota bacterium]
MKATEDMTIAHIIQTNPKAAAVFAANGMGCTGCSIARGETLREAAMAHGTELANLLDQLNEE